MNRSTRWGIALPQAFLDGPVDASLVRDFARRAETLNYSSLWVQDQNITDFPSPDPLGLLNFVAGVTDRIQLVPSVVISPLHHPAHLAKAVASLDQLSGGRLVLGIGLGNATKTFPAFNLPVEGRVRRFLEGLQIMRSLWTEPEVTYEGTFWSIQRFLLEIKPVQQPMPVWFGGGHPNAVRRAARHADGWMGAGTSTTAQFKENVGLLRRELEIRGRDPAAFPIAKRVYVSVATDKQKAMRNMLEGLTRIYGRDRGEAALEAAVYGTPDACAEGLAEVVAAGAGHIGLNQLFGHKEHLEVLAEQVIPAIG